MNKIFTEDLSKTFITDGIKNSVLRNINFSISQGETCSIIGASGCGKSTFLRCINRMNDMITTCKVQGSILLDDIDILSEGIDPYILRKTIGMVFQKPTPFPKSIYNNIALGLKVHGMYSKSEIQDKVMYYLEQVGLIDEIYNRVHEYASALSGGQQQRLCIAKTLALNPSIILMDEPCASLDPLATGKIESLIEQLSSQYKIIIVTHSMQQAARISNNTIFFHLGKVLESGKTQDIFSSPKHKITEDYITGRIG